LNVRLFSQTPYPIIEADWIKGKVKKIEIYHYYPKKIRPKKEVIEYDSLGRKTLEVNYYIKNDPHKKFISYNSVGNICFEIYEDNEQSHRHTYQYKYDTLGRITNLLEMRNNAFFAQYDSIVYNSDNLAVQYIDINQHHAKSYFSIQYSDVDSNTKRIYIKETRKDGSTYMRDFVLQHNEHGFLTKRMMTSEWQEVQKADSLPNKSLVDQIKETRNNMMNLAPKRHIEEYDYVDYKYDKQGNWIARKRYLNWEEKGRNLELKEKRKIEY
jgi:hypothetical protein